MVSFQLAIEWLESDKSSERDRFRVFLKIKSFNKYLITGIAPYYPPLAALFVVLKACSSSSSE